ncbi:MAG: VOC family protein [Azonexus sp.]|nr:VOC family protein [Azonexus sp.]
MISIPLGTQRELVIEVSSFVRAKRFYNGIFQCHPEQSDILWGTARYSLRGKRVVLKTSRTLPLGLRDTGIEISVDDFFFEYQRLQCLNIARKGAIEENPDGLMTLKIFDPDGNIVTLTSSESTARPSGK